MKAITSATMIDGNGGAPVENAVVLIDGDTIAAVGNAGSVHIRHARPSGVI